ncbi:acetolactate synthase-1/2/3 large subunit [Desulfobotulus alkaliphilus]|uniref:Acetolactate synthase-1/2/3 large subunit n=1 Tax=Desulfobotulus alkaliphilus TaxID=622671 RepID=A0A562RYT9_9BACT|nr:acetolactate synthase large subunit [Desulfobotulus alkaliphilus]TWI74289.1 acetolactate synthase-1/2/3 large subunit [Desulfobotulus alkaliphilus]
MNASEFLFNSFARAGVSTCYANPGTTEMPLVEAFDRVKGIRPVLCLFEGVATGAADGQARMTGKPGLTLLHLGPGFANGIANLHNARRAKSPVINLIGDHATWHRGANAPLTMPVENLAASLPGWVRYAGQTGTLGKDLQACYEAAMSGGIASLVLPHDLQAMEMDTLPEELSYHGNQKENQQALEPAADMLKKAKKAALLLGGSALSIKGLEAAAAICGKTGASLFMETFAARLERGKGIPAPEKIPYFPEAAIERLKDFDTIILAGMDAPVAFFGYPGIPGQILGPDHRILQIAKAEDNAAASLKNLAGILGANAGDIATPVSPLLDANPGDQLDMVSLGIILSTMQPENAIVVDEGISSGFFYNYYAPGAASHTSLSITGGAIGFGMPCAIGASMACPERPVIGLQADGSAMYTFQALWTQARENLPVTTILCENGGYNILDIEMNRAGITSPGPMAASLTKFKNPAIGWVGLAESMGVPAEEVHTAAQLQEVLSRRNFMDGPRVIVAKLAGGSM